MFSPMEQFVIFELFQLQITINNVIFYSIIASSLLISLNLINNNNIIPNYLNILSDSLYRTILNMIENFLNKKSTIWLPLLYTLFNIILFNNFIGLIPYSSTSSVEVILILSISFTLLIGILLIGFLTHKLYLLSVFLPGGTPLPLVPLLVFLEILAYLFRTISLALRLSINIMTGKILAKVIVGFIYIGYKSGNSILILLPLMFLLSIFLALEILIAYLQAYIFIFITILTISDLK